MKKNNLVETLKPTSKEYRLSLANIAIASGNIIVLDALKQLDNDLIGSKNSPVWQDEGNIRNICKFSSPDILDLYEKVSGKSIKTYEDTHKESCLHIAAKNGNIEVIKHLLYVKKDNPNRLSADHCTPLHSVLRNGEHTDLTIKDNKDKEPHRVRLKNIETNARLSSILEKEYLNYIKKSINPMQNLI